MAKNPPPPTIRQYRRGDDGEIWALAALPAVAAPDDPAPPLPLPPADMAPADCPDLADISRTFLMSGGDFLVAEVDRAVVGTAGLLISGKDAADVVRVRVHPALRRRGIGTSLLEAIEWRATGLGIRQLNLDVTENEQDAVAFFLASGFRNPDDDDDETRWDVNVFAKAVKLLP